ncbi:MAG: hypothetical protein E7448_05425 [Ruminococcaceae bacterium]|nr:hypothetical protein [Oscillospiraceae bacterium]
MSKTKFIVRVAMCVAMLIGSQLALSSISGVEVVTVMMLCFCFCYGIRHGVAVAITFSLLRCFIFGFQINVIVLYLIYYILFAVYFGWLGGRFSGEMSVLRTVIVVASAVVFTAFFTLLDDIITPLMYAFHPNVAKIYFFNSLYAVIPQSICTVVTVSVCFYPLTRVIRKINF